MSSQKASWFHRNILHKTFLYREQACGNFHPIWHRLCFCNADEHWDGFRGIWPHDHLSNDPKTGVSFSWHGGIRDLKTGIEYIPFEKSAQHDDNGMCVCETCSIKRKVARLRQEARANMDMSKDAHRETGFCMCSSCCVQRGQKLAKVMAEQDKAFAAIEGHDIARCSDELDATMKELQEVVEAKQKGVHIRGETEDVWGMFV